MEVYELIFDENQREEGVFAISVVEDPAMEGMFVAFNEDDKLQEVKLTAMNEEQRILLGVVAIPEKPIYRNRDGYEFYVKFSEETVKKAAHYFLKNQYNNNSTLEHEVEINKMSVVESWVIDDPENDKSTLYGFSYPKGSWMVAMKVDNDEIWNEYVKTGVVRGFSLEGMFALEPVNLKKDMEISKIVSDAVKREFDSIREFFNSNKEVEETVEEVSFAQATLADGETVVEYEGESLEVGMELFVLVPDAERIPAPDGEHELQDGSVVVTEGGLVTEIREPQAEEDAEESVEEEVFSSEEAEAEEAAEGEEAAEMSAEEIQNAEVVDLTETDEVGEPAQFSAEEFQAEFTKQLEDFKAEFSAQLEAKDKEIEDLKTQLSSTPATEPIKHVPADVQLSEQPKTRKGRLQNILKQNK